ncbi:MAG: MBL fold metallo-hydrolase [Thermoanaerobaculia bacterium]|jgi:glyoxylase-like metal-dependent hydrolase (beta-lactamase superfamily II)/ferredoxin
MANRRNALPSNVSGDFFVDSSCIDCDTCRIVAPSSFARVGDQSAVVRQPEDDDEVLAAQKAAVACPTSSIGSASKARVREAIGAYPECIEGDVHFCGYTSESSFGAHSYLVGTTAGNLLIDSPRFAGPLVTRIAAMGGVRRMLLTHSDDVADHARFHAQFGCERLIHMADAGRGRDAMERMLEGNGPTELEPGLLAIPVPGHTRGSVVFLWQERYLFSGDHLAWSERLGHLYAFRSACWYSWSAQIESMKRLLDYRFEWVLPGHGRRANLPAAEMRASLERCVEWMESHG